MLPAPYPGQMADVFTLLADPTRRAILRRLLAGAAVASEIADAAGVTAPTVSKHLAALAEAGLVVSRDEGRTRVFEVRVAPLEEVDAWLQPFFGAEDGSSAVGADAGSTIFAAWAGVEGTGERVGRAAADAAHSARTALEAAQEKIQGAQKRVAEKLPRWSRER